MVLAKWDTERVIPPAVASTSTFRPSNSAGIGTACFVRPFGRATSAAPFGRIVAGDDEALEAIATLARSDGAPVAPAREPADARLESARRILGAALALGARRSGDC